MSVGEKEGGKSKEKGKEKGREVGSAIEKMNLVIIKGGAVERGWISSELLYSLLLVTRVTFQKTINATYASALVPGRLSR